MGRAIRSKDGPRTSRRLRTFPPLLCAGNPPLELEDDSASHDCCAAFGTEESCDTESDGGVSVRTGEIVEEGEEEDEGEEVEEGRDETGEAEEEMEETRVTLGCATLCGLGDSFREGDAVGANELLGIVTPDAEGVRWCPD